MPLINLTLSLKPVSVVAVTVHQILPIDAVVYIILPIIAQDLGTVYVESSLTRI